MIQIAAALLFDRNNKLLIYLRDDKPTIPFPNHWDLFGGHLEEGETPEQALVRELKEELNVDLTDYHLYKIYNCMEGDAHPNIKHVYYAKINYAPEELTLYEGQYLISIDLNERAKYKFANILSSIVDDFAVSGLYEKGIVNS